MLSSIRSRITRLKKDRLHGAGWLTSQALEILEEASKTIAVPATERFIKDLGLVAEALMKARPGMVSIQNYVIEFKEEVEKTSLESKSTDNLKKRAAAIARKLKAHNHESSTKAAHYAARLVENRSIIITVSYSSDVCLTLESARQKGTDFKVLATESRSGRTSYGEITLERLKQSGIAGRIVPDNFISWHTARANIILTGSDAISQQGWMLNGTPSYSLARIASQKKVPVYTVCATAKIDVRGFLASLRAPEPGFDIVPLDLLKGIVTEAGILQPDQIYRITIDELFKGPRSRTH